MNIKTIIAAIALMAAPLCLNAQTEKSNKQLSEDLKNQINILNADIKALKARKKADPTSTEFDADLETKQAQLKEAKSRKEVIDDAIKAADKSKKETKEAEKAKQKDDKASKDADKLRASKEEFKGKSNELLSDELKSKIEIANADIKALKARKKADPTNTSLEKEISQKEVELKELKRNKEVFDNAIKTRKNAEKTSKKAEKAQEKHENAHEKAEDVKSKM